MAEETTRLGLPLIQENQAQKHITHNEAIVMLAGLVQASVINRTETAPPGSPADGDCYIVAPEATGLWDGWDLNIAYYVDGAWRKLVPAAGWRVYIIAENRLVAFTGADWAAVGEEAQRFAAFINFDQYVAADTWTKVPINDVHWNDLALFDGGTNVFTAPAAGMYQFGATIGWKQNNTNVPTVAKAKFVKNGDGAPADISAPVVSPPLSGLAVDGTELAFTMQCVAMLDAGDTVELQQFFADLDGYIPADITQFWGNKIG